jgi:glycosyltransferase involved in cell wall biosynthesis
MRLIAYTDYKYHRLGASVYAEKSFALFLAALSTRLDGLHIVGRLNPAPGRSHYELPSTIRFTPLPWYPTLSRPLAAAPAMLRSLRRFWRALEEVDGAWLLGPYLLSLLFVLLAALKRKRIVLGVRQDLPRYVSSRHPDRRALRVAGRLLELSWRTLARIYPTIVVGPDLERRYAGGRRLLAINVSLVPQRDIAPDSARPTRRYDGELSVLSVGRLEREKNPLLLADVLAELRRHDPRWRLVVCGDGPMRKDLLHRLAALGVAGEADLRGYVPIDRGLMRFYETSHFFLHVAWTEGLPQVLFEAFATRLPVVATAVGGVPAVADGCARLVPAGDATAATRELMRLADDAALRTRLTDAGVARVREHTIEAESQRVADFLQTVR